MSVAGDFAVVMRRTPAEVVIAVEGEVDAFSAPRLREAISSLAPLSDVVIDAAGLTFIDSSGLGVLVGAAKRLGSAGHSLTVRNARSSILQVLEITSLDAIVTIEAPVLVEGGGRDNRPE
jgi:anti-sigma B factor antagonist